MKKADLNKNVLDKNDKTRKLFVLTMFVPIILIEAVFFFGVNIQGLTMAFQKELPNGTTLVSFDNFIRIFTEGFEGSSAVFSEGIRNSLLFFGLSVLVMMPISVIVAYFLNKKIVGYKFFRVVLYLPNILPGIIISQSKSLGILSFVRSSSSQLRVYGLIICDVDASVYSAFFSPVKK